MLPLANSWESNHRGQQRIFHSGQSDRCDHVGADSETKDKIKITATEILKSSYAGRY